MSEIVVEPNSIADAAAPAAPAPTSADERISHRGPVQRLLVSPEIGAIIGAVLVWAFFWGNGNTFGTAATTLIFLDSAAPLGIMAVVVALLMIGGEFDLSAGMMTGATGILVGLMCKYFMDTGAPMWLAVGAAFVLAGTIGFFNGTLVNRTGLPSFIVTLATFFVLKGITLVLAKRLESKVSVTLNKEETRFYKPFFRFFAYDYKPQNFSGRDVIFFTMVIVGVALLSAGLCEQSFIRRQSLHSTTALIGLVGIAGAAVGFVMLHRTDGVSSNVLWSVVGGVAVVVGIGGLGLSRYAPRAKSPTSTESTASTGTPTVLVKIVAAGASFILLACLTPLVLNRDERNEILKWFPSWLRVAVAVVAASTGAAIALRQMWPRMRERMQWHRPIQAFLFAVLVGLLVMVGTLSFLQLTTVQALRAIAMMVFSGLGFALLLSARGRAGKITSSLQLTVGVITVAAIILLAFVVRHDSQAVRFRSGMFGAMILAAIFLSVNTVLEVRLEKRRLPNPPADKLGRRLVAVGTTLAGIGLAIRVVFTNLSNGQQVVGKGFSVTRMSIVWWIVITLIGAFVLTKTKWGNWIFAVGGNKEAARAIGVPASRVKTGLFVTVSMVGCFVGVMVLMRFTSVQASQGDGQEFFYIIAAVVGGNLLTGGYGSVIGASVGALIIAMSDNGIGSAGWNQDGKFAFKGAVLLIAVLVNNFIRKKAQEAR